MEEEINVLKNCWVMTTNHVLDEGNIALKLAIKNILNELDRLQKENEELKIDNNKQWKERCRLSFELDDSISKSVIEDKLNELKECNTSCLVEQIYNNGKKALCKELLNKEEE